MRDVEGVDQLEAGTEDSSMDIIWRPSPEYLSKSRLRRFMSRNGVGSLKELTSRAARDVEWFWAAVVQDLELEFYSPYSRVLDMSGGTPWAKWFLDGKFNYVHNALDKHARSHRRNKLALIWEGEEGVVDKLSYWDLYVEVNRMANALRSLGIGKGDRIGVFLPMIPEVVISTLACSKIGAIFTPIFSGYGAQSIAARLQDCEARLLITADGFYRRGNLVPMKETADEAVRQVPTVERVLVCRRAGCDVPWTDGRDIWWHEAIQGASRDYATEQTNAEDPYMLIYTSGTTGKPKGALHVHCGFPIKGAQDMAHLFDVQDEDILFWLTDIGWMMGPWAISGALILGSTAFLYDGTPDYPRPDRMWDMVERHGVTVLGMSPTVIRAVMGQGEELVRRHDLRSLRVLGSTGEPWNPDPYRWFFEHVGGGKCPIINYSGGTEISGGIVGCTIIEPIKPCSFSGPVPGIDADVVDDAAQPVRGVVGELVIRNPWPGMTRGFWKDPERYLDTYWSRWPDIWWHGDWALVDDDGFWFIHGRSDDTIKVAGKRVGPAEVESAAVSHPAVVEAAAIGVPHELKGEALVCFVVLRPGQLGDETLRKDIERTITQHLGKALKPEAVKFVRELPKTRNAKIMRRVIKAKYLGKDVGDISSLDNVSAVEEIGRAV